MENPQMRKTHKGGKVVRTEPVDMHLFDAEPMAREAFQRVGCLSFYQNMQRGLSNSRVPLFLLEHVESPYRGSKTIFITV
jgi:hypothetical protein